MFVASIDVNAQSDSLEEHTIKGKKYYIHSVEKGESLYAIGKKYDIPLDVIKKENPSVNDGLSIGEKVFIPVKRQENKVEITDGNYIEHLVEKKQTLYSIAKLYNVQQNEITAANPEIEAGLRENQVIKIPVKKLKDEVIEVESLQPTINKNALTHKVQKGETLYALSRKYGVSVDEIKQNNGGLVQGLREGELIIISLTNRNALPNSVLTSAIDTLLINDSILKKPVYKIGLMLPFYLDENDEIVENKEALEENKIYPKSRFAIEFYNGFIRALDSITTDSTKFKVYVYDTKGNDTLRVKELLSKGEFKEFDLLVGPLYYNNFNLVAEFAKENKIPVVTPVKQTNKILLGNPYVFKAISSKTAILKPLCQLVVDSFRNENLIVLEHDKAKEKGLVDLYMKEYAKKVEIANNQDTILSSSIKRINVSSGFSSIVNQCDKNKNNVIFLPSSDQTFVTSFFTFLITTLNGKDYENCKITLIGLKEWAKFKNIDLEYYQRLNVHYCDPYYISSEDSLTNNFIEDYIKKTETYPSTTAMLGFDLGYYFGSSLSLYGSVLSTEVLKKYQGNSITFNFYKTGIESGFENIHVHLLRYYDYTLQKLSY